MSLELENRTIELGSETQLEESIWGKVKPISESVILEASTLLGSALGGNRRKMLDLAEALTTSDLFKSALGEVLDREATDRYEEIQPVWTKFAARTTVRNFKPKKFTELFGGRAILDPVPEATAYPARNVDADEKEISVAKRGGRFHITFEDIINDDLDQLQNLPADLAQGARDTEDYMAASMLVNKNGINTAFFRTSNGNAPGTAPLGFESLEAALQEITERKTKDKRMQVNEAAILVIPTQLQVTARRILNAAEIRRTDAGGTTTIESNYLSGVVTTVVNPWLSFINESASSGTTWFLLPAPTARRKALAVAFLRGHETPDLRVKNDQGTRIGGGAVGADEGSFDDDTIQYRIRMIVGAATLHPDATYASTGQG